MKVERTTSIRTLALFLGPALTLLGIFVAWPLAAAFRLSVVDWNGVSPVQHFVGAENWLRLLNDRLFWKALGNNLFVVALSIVTQIPAGLGLAILLDRGGKAFRPFRTAYLLPMLMSTVAVGVLFKYLLDPDLGLVNASLRAVGLESWTRSWLGEPRLALVSVVAVISWQAIPFYTMLFAAAFTALPGEVREAAFLDGASEGQYLRRVALPMLAGTVRLAVLLALIGSLKYFDLVWVLTEGGPAHGSELMATYMYKKAFSGFDMGYGSTVAAALVLVVAALAGTALGLSRRYRTEGS